MIEKVKNFNIICTMQVTLIYRAYTVILKELVTFE